MIASDSVRRSLNSYDPNLEARWNKELERWEIWHRGGTAPPYMVLRVWGPRGEFVPLDTRVVAWIARGDRSRYRNSRQHLNAIDAAWSKAQADRAKRAEAWTEDFGDAMAWGIKRDF